MDIKVNKINSNNSVNSIPKKVNYNISWFYKKTPQILKEINIGIIGTGVPVHVSFPPCTDFECFMSNYEEPEDEMGISTAVAAPICACAGDLSGFNQEVNMYFSNGFGKKGNATTSSILAALLWTLAKKCQIVVLPVDFHYDKNILDKGLQKAINEESIVIAPKFYEKDSIANCKKVLAFKYNSKRSSKWKIKKNKINEIEISAPKNFKFYTAYLGTKYVQVLGRNLVVSIGCGLLLPAITNLLKSNKKLSIQNITNNIFESIDL